MNQFLEFFNQNPWLNVLFLILTLSSIFLSIWLYIKSKKSKRPTFAIRSFNLVKEKINKIDSVEIRYQNKKIDNLSITKLAIWNNGKETISSTDIAQNDPFRITIEQGYKILDYEIIFEKNKANGFSLKKIDDNEIRINFDYFDFNEGIIVQLYHTATEDEKISVQGSFKGTKSIERNSSVNFILPMTFYKILKNERVKPRLMKKIIGVMSFLVPLAVMISLFFIPKSEVKPEPTLLKKVITITIITLPYWWLSYKTLKRKVPKGFGIFEDEF